MIDIGPSIFGLIILIGGFLLVWLFSGVRAQEHTCECGQMRIAAVFSDPLEARAALTRMCPSCQHSNPPYRLYGISDVVAEMSS